MKCRIFGLTSSEKARARLCSDHLLDKAVDEFLSVTEGTITLSKGVSLDLESTEWRAELEWPKEVVSFLEFWAACYNLVDEILNAVDAVASELTSDDAVVGEWNSASVDSTVSSLIDKLGDGVSGWESVSDEWLNNSNHVPGSLVQLDEDSVVELSESQQLQDLLWLWGKLVDTLKIKKVLNNEKRYKNHSAQLDKSDYTTATINHLFTLISCGFYDLLLLIRIRLLTP